MPDEDQIAARLAEFREKAEELGVIVLRAKTQAAAARAIADWAASLGTNRVIVAAELLAMTPKIASEIAATGLHVDHASTPAETRDAPLGLSLACLAIAETGSLLLAEPSLEDRAVGMLSQAHAIVCPISRLVATLDDAAPVLRAIALSWGGSFSTLVTGPSRTADIERVLTVGVQGPGKVMTLFVDAEEVNRRCPD